MGVLVLREGGREGYRCLLKGSQGGGRRRRPRGAPHSTGIAALSAWCDQQGRGRRQGRLALLTMGFLARWGASCDSHSSSGSVIGGRSLQPRRAQRAVDMSLLRPCCVKPK